MDRLAVAWELRVLLAMSNRAEAELFIRLLTDSGNEVSWVQEYETAAYTLRTSPPDLLIMDESLTHRQREGHQLAEIARNLNELRTDGRPIHTIMLLPIVCDREQVKRARMTGAHVVARRSGVESVGAYVKVLADEIATDLRLGPFLFGFHTFTGASPERNCETCIWQGATLAYGPKTKDFGFERVDTCIFNALLFHQRGISGEEIVQEAKTDGFLRELLEPRQLVASAVKMRITRIRNTFTLILAELGAPFTGKQFLPYIPHGHGRYRLSGNWQLVHIRAERNAKRMLPN